MPPTDLALIKKWNVHPPKSTYACIHTQIQDVALMQPQSSAVSAWDRKLNYAELNDLSPRVAGFLRTKGVITESIVPHFFEKSAAAVVAMLGVLKAGGVLLALDVDHPADRINSILHDANAQNILRSSALVNKARGHSKEVIPIDMNFIISLSSDSVASTSSVAPGNACHVIFTLGSTGKPKGIICQ